MDFFALPPEVNSGRMYAGPGSGPLIAAATAWQGLAAELHTTAAAYSAAVTGLTSQAWQGPSAASMAAAAAPYVQWMTTTAGQAEQAAMLAQTAAGAYEAAFAMTVPPPVIAANRTQLATLVATNILGQNTAAIASTEAQYGEMWAQDVAAMENYAASSAAASNLTAFTSPPKITNSAGTANQAAAVAQTAAAATPKATTIQTAFGELDLIVAAGVAIGATGLSLTAVNLGRQFYRDYLGDVKDAAKADKDAEKPSSGGSSSSGGGNAGIGANGLGLRSAAGPPESAAGGRGGVVMASTGRSPVVGGMSVPATWAVPPEVRQLAKALPMTDAKAAPIALDAGDENPYTGMALSGLIGSGMGGLVARGGSPASVPARTPAAPAPAPKKAAAPAAGYALPLANTAAMPTEQVAAQLAATLAAMPGATIVVIPPSTASE